jgi:hypothetical protein
VGKFFSSLLITPQIRPSTENGTRASLATAEKYNNRLCGQRRLAQRLGLSLKFIHTAQFMHIDSLLRGDDY